MNDAAKEAFLEAIDADPAERRPLLQRRLSGDPPALHEALRLLEAHEAADDFFGAPTIAPGSEAPSGDRVGSRIGRYTVESLIGRGGFGSVYLATQTEPVERRVAVKVLRPEFASSPHGVRANAEWRMLARMEHPYIPKVYDAGSTPDGSLFFAMEYVPGRPITAFAADMPVRDRLALVQKACLGVHHLHQKGVIHRDIKPSNVLALDVDGTAEPRIIDCGIAKLIEPDGDGSATLTGQVIGTPAAMSPEQLTSPAAVDTRTDVYSLGVLLYEVVTGELPFDRERLRSASLAGIARIVCEDDPIRPSAWLGRAEPEGREAFREELDWVILKAIEKDPNRRYGSAADLAADLGRYLANAPLEAAPPSVRYRLAKLVGRHRAAAAAVAIAAMSLMAIALTSVAFAVRTERHNTQLAVENDRSRQFLEFATGLLRGIDPAVALGQDRTLLLTVLNGEIASLDASPPASDGVAYDVRMLLGDSLYRLAEFDRAIEQFALAEKASARAFGTDSIERLSATAQRGRSLTELSRFDEARELLDDACEGLLRTAGPGDECTLRARFARGALDRLAGDLAGARTRFESLLPACIASLGDEHEQTMSVRNSLGVVLGDLGALEHAADLLRRVEAYQSASLGEDHPSLLGTRNNLAGLYRREGRFLEAIDLMEQVIAAKRRVLGEDHPSTVVSLNNLGSLYESVDRHDDAGRVLSDALDVAKAHFGPDDHRTLILASNLAKNAVARSDYQLALQLASDALPRSDATLGATHALGLVLRQRQIEAARGAGLHDESVEFARSLVALLEASADAGEGARLTAELELCRSLVAAGAWEEARPMLELGYARSVAPPDADRRAGTEWAELLGKTFEHLGDPGEARRWGALASQTTPTASE